jgi:hypothetical protein
MTLMSVSELLNISPSTASRFSPLLFVITSLPDPTIFNPSRDIEVEPEKKNVFIKKRAQMQHIPIPIQRMKEEVLSDARLL